MSKKRLDSVELSWLESFVAAAEHGSFTAAGKALGVAQSTISRHVHSLERWLRTPLVIGDIPYELTEKGETFLEKAKLVIMVLQEERMDPSKAREYLPIDPKTIIIKPSDWGTS